jgi:hypothetical protein
MYVIYCFYYKFFIFVLRLVLEEGRMEKTLIC